MAMTHAQLVTQVIEMTGRSDKTTEIGVYVNWGQIAVVRDAARRKHNFSFLIKEKYASTADGTESYTFPSGMRAFYSLRIQTAGSERKLLNRTARSKDIAVPYPAGQSEGCPVRYTPWGRNFELSPIPDAVYTLYVRCSVWPTDMATGETSALLNMDDVLCNYGAWILFLSMNLEKDSRRFGAEYKRGLNDAILADEMAEGGEEDLVALPFVGGSNALEPGVTNEYWKKASFISSPM